MTVEMDIAETDVRRVSFHRSLIRSDARLTYGQVDEVFAGRARARAAVGRAARRRPRGEPRPARAPRAARSLEVNSLEPSLRVGRATAT